MFSELNNDSEKCNLANKESSVQTIGWEESRRLMDKSRSIVTYVILDNFDHVENRGDFYFYKFLLRPGKPIVHDVRTNLKKIEEVM